MDIKLTAQEFRYLLDLVYIGNWIVNSTRLPDDHIVEYDALMLKIFSRCSKTALRALIDPESGEPSRLYELGGIQEVIGDYEDTVFFEILAEGLVHRDMNKEGISTDNFQELASRMDEYIIEFEKNGIENLSINP